MKQIGRNDPCPCGSNKKYKKCHLIHNYQQDNQVEGDYPSIDSPDEIKSVAQSHHAFNLLGVESGFTLQELKSKYRAKIKTLHPDKVKGKDKEFQLIYESYKFLLGFL